MHKRRITVVTGIAYSAALLLIIGGVFASTPSPPFPWYDYIQSLSDVNADMLIATGGVNEETEGLTIKEKDLEGDTGALGYISPIENDDFTFDDELVNLTNKSSSFKLAMLVDDNATITIYEADCAGNKGEEIDNSSFEVGGGALWHSDSFQVDDFVFRVGKKYFISLYYHNGCHWTDGDLVDVDGVAVYRVECDPKVNVDIQMQGLLEEKDSNGDPKDPPHELDPGAFIGVNDDDDDNDGVVDLFDGCDLNTIPNDDDDVNADENDLVAVTLNASPTGSDYDATLKLVNNASSVIKIYGNQDKSGGELTGTGLEWDLTSESLPITVYAEGRAAGTGNLELQYIFDCGDGTPVKTDTVKVTVVDIDLDGFISDEDEETESFNIFVNDNFDQGIADTVLSGHKDCLKKDNSDSTIIGDSTDELGSLTLTYNPTGLSDIELMFTCDSSVKLHYGSTLIVSGTRYDPSTLTGALKIEGVSADESNVVAALMLPDGGAEICRDTIKVKAIPLDIDAVDPAPSADEHEICHMEKLMIRVNSNDSDSDGIIDNSLDSSGNPLDNDIPGGDPDIVKITLQSPTGAVAADISGDITVEFPANIFAWKTRDKTGGLAATTYSLSDLPKDLWLEGITASSDTLDSEIKLEMTLDSGVVCRDSIKYTVYSFSVMCPIDVNGDSYVNDVGGRDVPGNVFPFTGYTGTPVEDMSNVECYVTALVDIKPDGFISLMGGVVEVELEEISGSGSGAFTSTLTWIAGSSSSGTTCELINFSDTFWGAKAKFTGLPDVPSNSKGRVPEGMHDLLYKSRIVTLKFKDDSGTVILEERVPYEVCYGDSLTIDGEVIYDITFNEPWRTGLISLGGDKGQEMFDKMVCAYGETFSFADYNKVSSNFLMRNWMIYIMSNMSAGGSYDVGYIGNGFTYNSRTHNHAKAGDAFYFDDISVSPAVVTYHQGTRWEHVDFGSSNPNPNFGKFEKKLGTSYEAINNIYSFRGECAGAVEICYLQSAAETLGNASFNAIHPASFGVGYWYGSEDLHDENVSDLETLIPGDYIYMENFDYEDHIDYITISSYNNGTSTVQISRLWSGENCVYFGLDSSNAAKYGGLGLVDLTETELRNRLVTAYQREIRDAITYGYSGNCPKPSCTSSHNATSSNVILVSPLRTVTGE